MPSWVSNGGEWTPAHEKVALKNVTQHKFKYNGKFIMPNEPFIYDGPDREALITLKKEGVNKLGHNFRDDNEFLDFIHNSRFKGEETQVEMF